MDDDELPPWLGAKFQDAFYQIFRNQYEAELDKPATKEPPHVHE